MTPKSITPDPVDAHVGAVIRARRAQVGQTQQALAKAIGVSFQQVQKYEKGDNRVSASMLVMVARAQSLPVARYFEGLPPADGGELPAETREVLTWLGSVEAYSLASDLVRMDPKTRRAFAMFAAELARP